MLIASSVTDSGEGSGDEKIVYLKMEKAIHFCMWCITVPTVIPLSSDIMSGS